MDLVINYGLYFIAIFCVLTPVLAFGVFAPGIASSTVFGFIANWVGQYFDLTKAGKIGELPMLKVFKQDSHADDESPMWIDNAKPDSNDHHIIPPKTYIMIFLALIVGTIITVGVAYFDFGSMNMVIAMLVATAKASLVLLYFMHLKYDNMMNRVIFLSGFFFLMLLFAFTMGDIFSRILPVSSY
jgi:cytochrome c oxidase subunit 4